MPEIARSRRAWKHLLWAFDPWKCIEVGCNERAIGVGSRRCRRHYQNWYNEQRREREREAKEHASSDC